MVFETLCNACSSKATQHWNTEIKFSYVLCCGLKGKGEYQNSKTQFTQALLEALKVALVFSLTSFWYDYDILALFSVKIGRGNLNRECSTCDTEGEHIEF